MSVSQGAAGTLAAAVLGVGTTATNHAPKSARGTAVQVAHELARTGVNSTVMLTVLAVILLVGGFLLMSLSRRHTPPRISPPRFDPSYLP
ncbi:MAG: hypothetical protein QOF21_2926 [Actinomycetota bacterium]|jgi:LPXTG-motif cell wall-anchored protein